MISLRRAVQLTFAVLIVAALSAEEFRGHHPDAPPVSAGQPRELVVYAYDSFAAKGGLGLAIAPAFEKECGCKLKILPSGDGGQLVTRLELDARREKPVGDVVIGLDQNSWERAKPYVEPWGDWTPKGYDAVVETAKLEPGFLPFDYGVFAMMADTEALRKRGLAAPGSWAELAKPEYRGQFVLEDPRTSAPGLGFVLGADEVAGIGAAEYWRKLAPQWLTLTAGWDAAYGLFLRGEAPLVWSYTTSQAYHAEHGDAQGRYRALVFAEGNPIQVEGAALVRGALNDPWVAQRARELLEFLISPAAQGEIAHTNWMFPVLKTAELPPSFKALPSPAKLLLPRKSPDEIRAALSQWAESIYEVSR